jgi:hypothetical protein
MKEERKRNEGRKKEKEEIKAKEREERRKLGRKEVGRKEGLEYMNMTNIYSYHTLENTYTCLHIHTQNNAKQRAADFQFYSLRRSIIIVMYRGL